MLQIDCCAMCDQDLGHIQLALVSSQDQRCSTSLMEGPEDTGAWLDENKRVSCTSPSDIPVHGRLHGQVPAEVQNHALVA